MSQLIIAKAFSPKPDLQQEISSLLHTNPSLQPLFHSIAAYVQELQSARHHPPPNNLLPHQGQAQLPTSSKKRKIEEQVDADADADPANFDIIPDLSFSIPQRKKLRLDISRSVHSGSLLRATNPSTSSIEFSLRFADISTAICVPVPERPQPLFNFCLFPNDDDKTNEQILFTVPGIIPKPGTVKINSIVPESEETYKALTTRLLNQQLSKHSQKQVLLPDSHTFSTPSSSSGSQNSAPVTWVKAFRGTKEGYLFPLPPGLLFGFKKPLLFIPLDSISSISYTSVLQRTFNLSISLYPSPSSGNETQESELEFAMLDQCTFPAVDAYIKKHGLADKSMAEARRAKRMAGKQPNANNANGVGNGDGDGDEEGGELAKAQKEIEEMEEDENFDPGSEGESEGSGSSSEEEEEEGSAKGETNLVSEELGSEAEDVDTEEGE
ncbi:MAG: hypothetical protein Q9190_002973 [Brigantiaea leucoxantha]